MKNQFTIIAVCLLTTVYSCSPGSSTTTPATPTATMNSTETQLKGTWYQTKTETNGGFLDTTYTGYDNSCYVQLTSDLFPGTGTVPSNYKKAAQAFGAIPGPSYPSAAVQLWYYDESVSKFVLGSSQYSIVTLSATNLTIKNVAGSATTIFYFHK
jgi:hypothetical protein